MENDSSQTPFMAPPSFGDRNENSKPQGIKPYVGLLGAIAVVSLLLFGIISLFGGGKKTVKNNTATITQTPAPTITATPTPTKSSELNRSKLSIHILNGNGESGASKTASDFLEGLGYNVIEIGNAQNFDYAKTEIQIKEEKNNYLDLLKKDLSEKYTIGSSSADLSPSDRADAYITIGKQ